MEEKYPWFEYQRKMASTAARRKSFLAKSPWGGGNHLYNNTPRERI